MLARGRVQGVFFRDSVLKKAEEERVAGWVTNRDDGGVEAVVEGRPEAVERLIEFIRDGPGRAQVARAEVNEEQPEGIEGFRVK